MKNIKVKNYAEYNSPFMGLFNQFYNETKMNTKYYKILHTKLINYLSSRQLAEIQETIRFQKINLNF